MDIRDRIVGLKRVQANQLKGNDANWRVHPDAQRGALTAMLEEIGFVGALIVRPVGKGNRFEIIDGHLRADIADDAKVPVLVTDLTSEEARKILLTYDPIGSAAETDGDALAQLIGSTELPDHADTRKLVADLEFKRGKGKAKREEEQAVEGMELRPHEHYDYVVVLASTNQQWNALCDRLGLKKVARHKRKRRSIGLGRAIRAEALLDLLPDPRATKK